jgi:large subunit ribosomal protein L3
MMKRALFLKKLSMSSLINDSGSVVPVTVLEYIDQEILSIKTKENDGYEAVQFAFGNVSESKLNKPKLGIFKKKNKSPKKNIKELRFSSDAYLEYVADSEKESNTNLLSIESFEVNDRVSLRSKSKGKGFQGTIKAHNFKRGPMSHGSKNHRLPGSIGAGTDPARVLKGTRMAKRLGNKFVTISNLLVVKIDSEKGLMFVQGSIPGNKNEYILMYK